MITEWLLRKVGGKATLRVTAILALALGLDSADMAAVGAMALNLEKIFGTANTYTYLLVTRILMGAAFGANIPLCHCPAHGMACGAATGVLAGGRIGDRLLENGRINGRIIIAAGAYLMSTILFVPGLLLQSVWLSLSLFWPAQPCVSKATNNVRVISRDPSMKA